MSQIKPVYDLAIHFFRIHLNVNLTVMSFLLPSDSPTKLHTHFASLRTVQRDTPWLISSLGLLRTMQEAAIHMMTDVHQVLELQGYAG